MSEELKDMESGADRVFYKDPTIPPEVKEYAEPVDLDKLLDGVTLTKLQKIFESVMKRQQDKIDPVRSTFGTIKKDPVSLEDKITSVLGLSVSYTHLVGGVMTPQYQFFYPRCAGYFELPGKGREKSRMIVGRGLGTHSINIRLNDKPQVVVVRLCGADTQQ